MEVVHETTNASIAKSRLDAISIYADMKLSTPATNHTSVAIVTLGLARCRTETDMKLAAIPVKCRTNVDIV